MKKEELDRLGREQGLPHGSRVTGKPRLLLQGPRAEPSQTSSGGS